MKKAFTLVEVMMVMIVIGILATALLKNFKSQDYTTKKYAAYGMKAIELVEQAAAKITEIDKVNCPLGTFMSKRGGKSDFTYELVNASGNSANATEVATLFGKYIRYETGVIDYCSNTLYTPCSDIMGGKLPGARAYIGFKVYSNVSNCPAYRMPNDTADVTPQHFDKNTGEFVRRKCWGELHIDINGIEPPNQRGKDVHVFGMGEHGIAK